MKKKIVSAALALCLVLSLLPGPALGLSEIEESEWGSGLTVLVPAAELPAAQYQDAAGAQSQGGDASPNASNSGGTGYQKLSKLEIVRLLEDNPLKLPDEVMEQDPHLSNPYTTGKVKTEALQIATNRLNALRRLAGLPPVALDSDWSNRAQYGAVLLAVSNFGHYPNRPSDMDSAFFETATAATSSSNIYGGVNLTRAVDGFMADSDASNVSRLGHRRWQLNPGMTKVGFGYAYNASAIYRQYVDEKVFESKTSGPGKATIDYDFLAWPASGYFPSDLFGKDDAWSVTLNPNKYATPSLSKVKVTLTRQSDGQRWTFSNSWNYIPSGHGEYFNVDTGGYGVANCIIFRPSIAGTYSGVYTVEITGLQNKKGSAVTLSYQVEFFQASSVGLELNASMFTVDTSPEIYDGTDKTKSITARNGDVVLQEGTDYTVSYSNNRNVGTATIVITPRAPYRGDALTYHFEIQRAQRALTASPAGGRDQLYLNGSAGGVTISDNASGDNPAYTYRSGNTAVVTVDGSGKVTPVGLGTATVTVTSPETVNYTAGESAVTFTVGRIPSQDLAFGEPGPIQKTYGDDSFANPAVNRSQGGGAVRYASDNEAVATVDGSGAVTIHGAGQAVITATAAEVDGQYALTNISYTLTVAPRPLTITGAGPFAKTYDGSTDAPLSGLTFSNVVSGEELTMGKDYSAFAQFDTPDAGTGKAVQVTAAVLNGNYTLEQGTYTAQGDISKAPGLALEHKVELPIQEGYERKVDLSGLEGWPARMGGTPVYALDPADSGRLSGAVLSGPYLFLFSSGKAADKDADTLTVRVTGMGNYEDSQVTVQVVHTARTPVVIDRVSVSDKTYDGRAASWSGTPSATVEATGKRVSLSSGDFVYTWMERAGDGSYVALETAPVDAGEYQLAVSVADGEYAGRTAIPFRIKKAALTVQPADQAIFTGDDLPQRFDLTYRGFVSGDGPEVLTVAGPEPTFSLMSGEKPLRDSSDAGVYTIQWTNREAFSVTARNYEVSKADGNLSVWSTAPLLLDDYGTPWNSPFSDVRKGQWFYDDVGYVTRKGLMVGTSKTAFSPDGTASRAMVVTILARISGVETAGGSTWYERGLTWAVRRGLTDGHAPEQPVTREEMITMMWRSAGWPTAKTSSLNRFSDTRRVDDWALEAMAWAVEKGILAGDDQNCLDPRGGATRSEMAAILTRYCRLQ